MMEKESLVYNCATFLLSVTFYQLNLQILLVELLFNSYVLETVHLRTPDYIDVLACPALSSHSIN